MAVNDQRRIVQGRINKDKEITPESINEALRQISTALHKLEGRSGQVNVRDNLSIKTDKATALEIDSGAGGKAAIVAFGTDNSGIALAKGSKRNEAGQWIATDTVSVIWAVSREGWASLYVNNNLRVGEAFEPIVVVTLPGGTNPLLHNGLGGRSDADAHPAAAITNTAAGLIVSTNVQAAINELDSEKLARDGTQTMLGTLQMNSNPITNITDASFNGGVGNGVISGVRKIHMVGLEADGEARIDGIRGMDMLSETALTPAEGRLVWDATEGCFAVYARHGAGAAVVLVSLGWGVMHVVGA